MARYQQYTNASSETLFISEEHSLYGSARIGVDGRKDTLYKAGAYTPAWCGTSSARRELGNKHYELSNHLGNVLLSVTDKKAYKTLSGSLYFEAEISTISDYYPFGSAIQTRAYSAVGYRFGFNTQERETELGADLTSAEFWMYDGKLGRRWNVDPVPILSCSNYGCFANNPIQLTDHDGDTAAIFKPDGSFWKFVNDGKIEWSGVFYTKQKETGSKTENGVTTTYLEYTNPIRFTFNDPSVDILAIRNGVKSGGKVGISRIELLSDESVIKQIQRSGVHSSEAQRQPLTYAKNKSESIMDYGLQGIRYGELKTNTFYIRESIAYNVGDVGNYLWGRGMGILRIDIVTATSGAHWNNITKGRNQKTAYYDFGPGTYGSAGFFDSPGDQRAIRAGYSTTPYYQEQQQKLEKVQRQIDNDVWFGPRL